MAMKPTHCYETIMFGRVTHTLDAAAMGVRSLFTSFTFCNITGSCSLIPKENICCSITCVSLIEILATINLYFHEGQRSMTMLSK